MASGDPVVTFGQPSPPDANSAPIDMRAGGSTPAENVPVWDFDAGTIEYMDFMVELGPNYADGGLTFTVAWSASTATSGNTVWGIAIRAMPDDTEDIDSSHTYAYNEVTAAAPSASGEVAYDTITFTDGVDMDSWAAGERAVLRVRRNATSGSDTMTGDAELWGVSGKET